MDFKRQLASALVFNVALKMVTFLLTAAVTRQLAPNENGINFSFQLYFNTVLFLARESVRSVNARNSLRGKAGSGVAALNVMNCAVLSIPIGVAVMAVLEVLPFCRVTVLPSLTTLAGGDSGAVGLPEMVQVLSVLVVLSVEPCIALVQSLDDVRAVVASEFWALFARLVTSISFVWLSGGLGGETWTARLCFSFANLSDSVATVVYFFCLWNIDSAAVSGDGNLNKKEDIDSTPVSLYQVRVDAARALRVGTPSRGSVVQLNPYYECVPWLFLSCRATYIITLQELQLLLQFFRESCLRLLLAEGEHFALAAMGSTTAVGQYSVVTNLGSLVPRIVFRVWETACFTKWSRDVADGRISDASFLLFLMLRVALYFGALVLLLGPPLAKLILLRLLTRRWATPETVNALQLYCYQLPLMGWYGLLDAFVRATASTRTLQIIQRILVTQAAMYVVFCFVVLRLNLVGDPVAGLIAANGLSTALRCVTSIWILIASPDSVRQRGKQGLELRQFASLFDRRIAAAWFLLFGCTRVLPWFLGLTASGVFCIALVFPLFVSSVLVWDPEISAMGRELLVRSGLAS
uniref:Protein RFT1 homolog n=1 Tax=Trypanosoma congolense (strain IL3000) TaxID=1068625 RepID=G0V263_TRYCI|nr:unnamed protein product [Trypanosoma congolense IL3000]